MKLRLRSSRWPVGLVFGALMAVARPQLSEAKCRAVDFDANQIQIILKDVTSSKKNIAADMENSSGHFSARPSDLVFLMAAGKDVQGEGMLVAAFTGLLYVRSAMTTQRDRSTVDGYIGIEAALIYQELETTADQLSQALPGEPHPYGEYEIKEARDLIRKLQSQFSCAANDK